MAVYGLSHTSGIPTHFPWNGDPLRRLVRKMKDSFAPIPHTDENRGSFAQVWDNEYWFVVLRGLELPRT